MLVIYTIQVRKDKARICIWYWTRLLDLQKGLKNNITNVHDEIVAKYFQTNQIPYWLSSRWNIHELDYICKRFGLIVLAWRNFNVSRRNSTYSIDKAAVWWKKQGVLGKNKIIGRQNNVIQSHKYEQSVFKRANRRSEV